VKKLRCNITCAGQTFPATLDLPDTFFDPLGRPFMNMLNNRFAAQPIITWLADWQCDGEEPPAPPIAEELQKLREVVVSLEQKFNG